MTKAEQQTFLKKKLGTDDRWALRALMIIYSKQTADEQQSETTKHHNSVGFTGTDGEILTSFAKQYEKNKSLSWKQMNLLKKKMPKYWKQILGESDSDALEKEFVKDSQQQTLPLAAPAASSFNGDREYVLNDFKNYFGEERAKVGCSFWVEIAGTDKEYYTYEVVEVTNDKVLVKIKKETKNGQQNSSQCNNGSE